MFIRPMLICGAGILALQLLAFGAAPITPVDPPKGWTVSESVGKQYRLGYAPQEKAYFIENAGKASDPAWLLQSIKAQPYYGRKLRIEAEAKADRLRGQFCFVIRGIVPDQDSSKSSNCDDKGSGWQTLTGSVVLDIDPSSAGADRGFITFGFLLEGEGRLFVRNVKLVAEDDKPVAAEQPKVWDNVVDPPALEQPANLELRR